MKVILRKQIKDENGDYFPLVLSGNPSNALLVAQKFH